MRCQDNSLIQILELRCIFSFNKWSFCSDGGSEVRLGDDAGQPLAASRGAPASSEIHFRAAAATPPSTDVECKTDSEGTCSEETLKRRNEEWENGFQQRAERRLASEKKVPEEGREMLCKRPAEAALQVPQKQKSEPSQPGAPPPEHLSLERPEGERPRKKGKSCAKPAAIGAASSSGSQEVVQTTSAPEPLLRPCHRNSNKGRLIEPAHPVTERNVICSGQDLLEFIEANRERWSDEVGCASVLFPELHSSPSIGVDPQAYNKATPPFNR